MTDIKGIAEVAKRDANREAEICAALHVLKGEPTTFRVECTLASAGSNAYKAAHEVETHIARMWPEIREDVTKRLQAELAMIEEGYRPFEKFLIVDQGVEA